MKKQVHEQSLVGDWQELPASRRHLYFYILLLLLMMLANSLRNQPDAGRANNITETPPGIAAKEVYPAPVNR